MSRANLWGANLWGANLGGANLEGANLCNTNLCDVCLCGANLRNADLENAYLREANLRDTNLQNANLSGANLQGARLWNADLRGAKLQGANLRNADLGDADLRGIRLWNADLQSANLLGANLCNADLRDTNLQRANLRNANLTGVRGLVKLMGVAPGNYYWKRFEEGLVSRGYQFHVGLNCLRPGEEFASDERILCSYPGFYFGSRSWCAENCPGRPLEALIRIPEDARINEPWATDGKASADKIEIIRVFDARTGEDVTDQYRLVEKPEEEE